MIMIKRFIEFLRKLFCITPEQVVMPEVPAEHKVELECAPEVAEVKEDLTTTVVQDTEVLPEAVPEELAKTAKPKKKRGPRKKKVAE